MLVPALLRAMGRPGHDIAGLHRHFNALQLVNTHQVLQTVSQSAAQRELLPCLAKALVERAIALRIDHQLKATSLGAFGNCYCTMAPPLWCIGALLLIFPAGSRPSVRQLSSAI